MAIHRQYKRKLEEFRSRGVIKDYKKDEWFIFETEYEDKSKRKEPKLRTQKVQNKEYNYFRTPSFKQMIIRAIYLNKESEEGLYKNPEDNLPYEIWGIGREDLIYRQSIIETKKNIFKRLEKIAIEEGLRKID